MGLLQLLLIKRYRINAFHYHKGWGRGGEEMSPISQTGNWRNLRGGHRPAHIATIDPGVQVLDPTSCCDGRGRPTDSSREGWKKVPPRRRVCSPVRPRSGGERWVSANPPPSFFHATPLPPRPTLQVPAGKSSEAPAPGPRAA